jgi:hypothetical protein
MTCFAPKTTVVSQFCFDFLFVNLVIMPWAAQSKVHYNIHFFKLLIVKY